MRLSEKQEESIPQNGNDNNAKKLMKKLNLAYTRENYLDLMYLGDVPEKLSAEEELELPLEFQKK